MARDTRLVEFRKTRDRHTKDNVATVQQRRFILVSTLVFLATLASGFLAVVGLGGTENISRYLFVTVGLPGFLVMGIGILVAAGISATLPAEALARIDRLQPQRLSVLALSLVMLVTAMAATHLVYAGYALSMDEWMPRLQARIFLDGTLTATLPPEWQAFGRAMFHSFATYDPATGQVASSYRPGLAGLIAAFDVVGLGIYLSSMTYAGAIWLSWVVTRQLLPGSAGAPMVAALLVATSQQALAGAMTSYAMSSHLFFNLLWLHLFLRDRMWAHVLAALVGVLTASLHQVHMHFFFAAPFLLTLLRPFRPGLITLYFLISLFGHLAVIGWDNVLIRQAAQNAPGVARTMSENLAMIFRLPDAQALATIWANCTRLIGWQSLALLPLLVGLAASLRTAPRWSLALLGSILFSLLPYVFLMPDQGHGWGFRYLHGLIGNLAILAAFGWALLPTGEGAARVRAFCLIAILVTPLLMFPLRAQQIAGFTKPFAKATQQAHAIDADVVVVDSYAIFVGADIPRNDPTVLDRPVVMALHDLEVADIRHLCARGTVRLYGAEDAARLGIRERTLSQRLQVQHQKRLTALAEESCRQP